MSHGHFCYVGMHLWECGGTVLHSGEKEPSVCLCITCELPVEQGDHSECICVCEQLVCPEHIEEEQRMHKANRPRIIAALKRRKAALDAASRSTPESDQFYERIIKRLESED